MFQDLHQIILALTTSEFNSLEYFLKQHDSHRDFNYVLLFQCLYDMEDGYDEDYLLAFCVEHDIDRESLRVSSYDLNAKIMLYLRDPKVRPDPVWSIDCLLKDARIMERKGLFEIAIKRLKSALEIADKNRLPGLAYKAHLTYSSLLLKMQDARNIDQVIEQYQLGLAAWQRYQASQEVVHVNHEAFHTWLLQSYDFADLKARAQLDAESIPEELSFFAQLRYTQTRNIFSLLEDQSADGIKWQTEALNIFANNETLQKSFPFEYIAALGNYLNAAFTSNAWELFPSALAKLSKVETEDPLLLCIRGSVLHLSQLNYWANHPEALAVVTDEELDIVIEFLEENEAQITNNKYTAIAVALASIFLLRNNHDLARHWWRKIKTGHANNVQPRTQRMALLVDLLNDYADPTYSQEVVLGRIDNIRKKLPKIVVTDAPETEATLTKRNQNLPHEKISIRYLRKLTKLPLRAKKEKADLINKFHNELKACREDLADHDALITCDLFLRWLEIQPEFLS